MSRLVGVTPVASAGLAAVAFVPSVGRGPVHAPALRGAPAAGVGGSASAPGTLSFAAPLAACLAIGAAAQRRSRKLRSIHTAMLSYKLTYFDGRALGEVSRFIFAIAKQPYEDKRFSFSFGVPGDFRTIKRPEFDAAKAAGELDVSLGKVPYLEVDGVKIGQSKAIERFLAGQFGMMGSSPIEAAQIDQLCESIRDSKDAYQKARATAGEEEKKAAIAKFYAEDLPAFMKLVEKSIPAGPGPFLVGGKVSLADIIFYHYLLAPKGYLDNPDAAAHAIADTPKIKAAVEAVHTIKELQEWIAKRPDTPF